MEIRDLEYFVACVDAGSLTRAAARVHAAQPTLSHALGRLERELGQRLLERAPHAELRTTDAGEVLLRQARRTLSDLARVKEEISALSGELVGTIRAAATPSLSATLLPGVLARVVATHPGLRVTVRTLPAERTVAAVASGREDVGLVAAPHPASLRDVVAERLYSERFVAVVARRHPLAKRRRVRLSQLAGFDLLLPPENTLTSALLHESFAQAKLQPNTRFTLAAAEALREGARHGLGVALLPAGYVRESEDELRVIDLTHPTPRREVFMILQARAEPLRPALRMMIEAIRREPPR